ncbi:MAG TPA: twin-arginine translocase subunit TatC [Tepidisphaeraceae bacterium]|nr:twin-arginine translocase subunit TatC [Tepidisphaeraceae bacterium]
MTKTDGHHEFDPDQYRMSIGEHLEELRMRLIMALLGFAVVAVFCLIFGQQVMSIFCKPLITVLQSYEINPQIYFTQMSDPFMVYIEISMISATAIASPWIVYQIWQFVAAGLYPSERKIVTKYVPLSITLLISGMVFVYYLVLPWTLQFFLAFSISIPLPTVKSPTTPAPTTQNSSIQMLDGDPEVNTEGQVWINRIDGRLKLFYGGKARILPFGPENLTAPLITLPDYIDLVFGMLLTFGLSFQLPLVVMALVAIGILEIAMLKASRRYVYFGMSILAAAITPGDVITATIALMIPLIGLFELGIWLARSKEPKALED